MPTTIKQENWDGVAAPAIPSGWSVASPLVTNATNPRSGSNALAYPAASINNSTAFGAVFGTQDGNSGNCQASCWFRFESAASATQLISIMLRKKTASGSDMSSYSGYTFQNFRAGSGSGVYIYRTIAGANTAVASLAGTPFANDIWYYGQGYCSGAAGTTLKYRVMRASDGFWLNSSGTWVSDATNATYCLSATDSNTTLDGQGYAGVNFYTATAGGTTRADDFQFDSLASGTPAITLTPSGSAVLPGAARTLVARVVNAPGPAILAATTSSGTLSTAAPVMGSSFTITAPGSGSGSITVTVTEAADSLSTMATVNYRSAATYYLDNAGSDSNAGTSTGSGGAWQTLAKVNSSGLVPGDSALLKSGQTFSGSLHVVPVAATPAAIVTIGVHSGTAPATISCGDSYGVWIEDSPFVIVQDLAIVGSGVSSSGVTTSTSAGILATLSGASSLAGIVARRNSISGCYYGVNFRVAADASGSFVGPIIRGNAIDSCGFAGVLLFHILLPGAGALSLFGAHDLRFIAPLIALNAITNAYGVSNAAMVAVGDWVSGCASGFGVMVANASGGSIEDNLVHHCGAASSISTPNSGGMVGVLICESSGLAVRRNEVHHVFAPEGFDGQGIDCDGGARNCIIERNYVHDCDGGAFYCFNIGSPWTTTANNTFRWNISQNNGLRTANHTSTNPGTFLAVNGVGVFGATGTLAHNNTDFAAKVANSMAGSIGDAVSSGTIIRDNILIASGSGATFGSALAGTLLQGNLYFATGGASFSMTYAGSAKTSLSALRAVAETASGGAVGTAQDPQLAVPGSGGSDYTPGTLAASLTAYDPASISSACLAAGLDMAGAFGVDPGSDFHAGPARPASGSYPAGAVAAAATVAVAAFSPIGCQFIKGV